MLLFNNEWENANVILRRKRMDFVHRGNLHRANDISRCKHIRLDRAFRERMGQQGINLLSSSNEHDLELQCSGATTRFMLLGKKNEALILWVDSFSNFGNISVRINVALNL